jgi:hypothetical protein
LIADDDGMRELLRSLSPSARGHLRNVLIHDQADRDAIASNLLHYRNERGNDWAEIIDFLTMMSGGAASGCAAARGTQGRGAFPVANRRGLGVKGSYVRLVGWLMVFAALFALGFSVRVMESASEATAASGLSGVVASLIVLAVGSFLVVRFRTS